MTYVFVSYLHENKEIVSQLYKDLTLNGVEVRTDQNIPAGSDWKQYIRKTIKQSSFFIACFSNEYNSRGKTYMNEELTLAIEELRQRTTDGIWFIPIKLSECEIPDRDIGGGRTLQTFQWIELYKDWGEGIQKLLNAIEHDNDEIELSKQVLEIVEEVRELHGLSADKLIFLIKREISKYRNKKYKEKKPSKPSIISKHRFITEVLVNYYNIKALESSSLNLYAFVVNGIHIYTSIASKNDWVGLSIRLDGDQETCELISDKLSNVQIPENNLAEFIAYIEETKPQIWNAPIYRLFGIELTPNRFKASFAMEKFYNYRFTFGLLREELTQALISAEYNIDKLLLNKIKYLPLREQLLPDGYSLVNFHNRMCAGGVVVLSAFARSQNDYAIPIQRRSGLVIDSQGMLSVIPTAIHQPMIEHYFELNPSFTAYREIGEELFNIKELNRDSPHVKFDWFFNKKQMKWLRENRGAYTLKCSAFGIDLLSGNYEITILFAVHDDTFWNKYGDSLINNWETSNMRVLSSNNSEELAKYILEPEWSGEGLLSFIEGLRLLKTLDKKRVNLPSIERMVNY
jgi:hypothetical protein